MKAVLRTLIFVAGLHLVLGVSVPSFNAQSDRGAITGTVGLLGIVYGLTHSATAGWGNSTTIGSLVIGGLLLALFLVIESRTAFPDYAPPVPEAVRAALGLAANESPLMLSIALIAAEWMQSTINLRAPLMVAPSTMRAAQIVLSDSAYRLDQPLAALTSP